MKKRIFTILLTVCIMCALLSVTASAESIASHIAVSDATYYAEDDSLKSVKITFDWGNTGADARLVLMTKPLRSAGEPGTNSSYGDFTDFGYYGQKRWEDIDEALAYDVANDQVFGILSYTEKAPLPEGFDQRTFTFEQGAISATGNQTYYIYLWTYFSGIYYPDALVLAFQVQDGVVKYTPATDRNTYDPDALVSVPEGSLELYSVTVTAGSGMEWNFGDETQENLYHARPMEPVTYTALSGYYFPEYYSIVPVNGISVTRNSASEITVSGTPTGNTELVLPAAISNAVHVSFDPNGGTGTMDSVETTVYSRYTIPESTFTAPENAQFLEWALNSVNGDRYQPNEIYVVNSDTTLIAIWERTYTISGNERKLIEIPGGTNVVINGIDVSAFVGEDAVVEAFLLEGQSSLALRVQAGSVEIQLEQGDRLTAAWYLPDSTEALYTYQLTAEDTENGITVSMTADPNAADAGYILLQDGDSLDVDGFTFEVSDVENTIALNMHRESGNISIASFAQGGQLTITKPSDASELLPGCRFQSEQVVLGGALDESGLVDSGMILKSGSLLIWDELEPCLLFLNDTEAYINAAELDRGEVLVTVDEATGAVTVAGSATVHDRDLCSVTITGNLDESLPGGYDVNDCSTVTLESGEITAVSLLGVEIAPEADTMIADLWITEFDIDNLSGNYPELTLESGAVTVSLEAGEELVVEGPNSLLGTLVTALEDVVVFIEIDQDGNLVFSGVGEGNQDKFSITDIDSLTNPIVPAPIVPAPTSTRVKYRVTVQETTGGTVTTSTSRCYSGSRVTITVTPDAGYVLSKLTVARSTGKILSYQDKGNGTYTFLQAANGTVITAEFVLAFQDITPDHQFYPAIQWVYENGLMNGVTETNFDRTNPVTRQQVWRILARILNGEDPGSMAAAKEWAVAQGITDGINPGTAATRQEFVTMLWIAYGKPAADTAALAQFADAASVADDAAAAMAWAVSEGIVGGYEDGTLRPAATATRGAFAAILYRYLAK